MRILFFSRIMISFLFFSLSFSDGFAWENEHGLVGFGGKIIETPCYLDADSVDQSIDMGKERIGDKSDVVISQRIVEIKFRGCLLKTDNGSGLTRSTVNIIFQGMKSDRDSALWAVSGDADGVALKIMDRSYTIISEGEEGVIQQLADGDNTITLIVQLVSVMKTIKAGSWHALISFKVSYY
ncbi:hypothetical protein RBA69_17045 [Brenneria goodwinii]|uniref:fimbrial protein n=1 Tax=Brenneria goodwinii TaxID=1109412 RepID=UPI0036F02766